MCINNYFSFINWDRIFMNELFVLMFVLILLDLDYIWKEENILVIVLYDGKLRKKLIFFF